MFRVGQKVVCVDDSEPNDVNPSPVLGVVYTVASVRYITADISIDVGWGVTLVELHSIETDEWLAEYRATRFRPAVDRPTDISCFKALLRDRELVG
jgi:hypothetical protein